MKNLTIFDPESPVPKIDDRLGQLDEETAAKVAQYLLNSTMVFRVTLRVPDCLSGSEDPVVPVSTFTDGEYIWSEAVAYYVSEHRVAPPEEFVEHCRRQNFLPPRLTDDEIQTAARVAMA